MEMVIDIIKEIIELLQVVDFPTAYLMVFTPAWLLVLIGFAIFIKKDKNV